ncbi:hypothetical protein Mic7113_4242 [Allocoleopsis franciscana PCC 7113]|uniref:Uncharacterized protein n=2 Tax=Allocoleopsis TaxID=2886347 RepID=K9WJE9_9CYAN|nr:hypothetical protein Mic7113_4242 [Allocoleopsis franciscana PCC 7113]
MNRSRMNRQNVLLDTEISEYLRVITERSALTSTVVRDDSLLPGFSLFLRGALLAIEEPMG